MICPSCAAELPPGARFCPSCGQQVNAARTEERRIVTVLFADIVGFTGIAEHRDPEQVKRIIDSCMDRLAADIGAFGGTIDKILGDGLLALFGAPVAHEDDAERAVRAALRMQEGIAALRGPDGEALRLRIGINTGEVVVGALAGARGDYTAMGDVVNTAARLQALAPPGRVLVGESTHQLTEATISFEPYGDVLPRGREHALAAWLAIAPTAPPGERRRHRELPLVGRDDELGLLLGGIRYAFARRRAFLAAIEGEGGVGKSRIVSEVLSRVRYELGVPVLEGSCVPYGEPNAWWPLASAIVDYFDVAAAADPEHVRTLAAAKGTSVLEFDPADFDVAGLDEAFMHLLGQPSALDELEPVRAREELSRTIGAVLQAHTRRGPLVLALTDVHWADPAVIALLEQLLSSLAELPLVVLTTARRSGELNWPPIGPYSTLRLRLEPLDPDAAAELVRAILGEAAEPATIDRLYERSGGNPLFLEELTELVADRGGAAELPDSLRALISARLDQLGGDERAVLDNAAVLGGSGSLSALVSFGEGMGIPDTETEAVRLTEAGLLAIEQNRWRFRSESVREVAYQTLTKAARAQRHAWVAAEMVASGKPIRAEEIAHHWATAAELVTEIGPVPGVPGDVRDLAVRWLGDAAWWAADQMYPHAAVRLADRALELIADDDAASLRSPRRRLQLVRADALAELRQLDRARDDVSDAMHSALVDQDSAAQATAHRQLGDIERCAGNLIGARVELDTAIRLSRELGDSAQLARALRTRGFVEMFGESPADATPFLDEADELYLRLGDRAGHAWVEQNRAWLGFLAGELSVAEERLHRAAAVMEEIGDNGGIGWAFGLLAYVRFYSGNREEAAQIAATVGRDAAERGDEWAVGMMQALQANLQLWEGHINEALRLAEGARQRMRKLGDGYGQIQAIAPTVRALAALGRFADSRSHMEELDGLAPRFGMEGFAALVELGAALHVGASAGALDRAEVALDRGRSTGVAAIDARLGYSLALAMEGRLDEAQGAFEAAAPSEGLAQPYAQAVAALLALLGDRPEDAAAASAAVLGQPSATYVDRIYALIVRAAIALRDRRRDDALVAVEQAWLIATGTEDLVAVELVSQARRRLQPNAPAGVATFRIPGWQRVLDGLFRSETSAAPART